MSTVLADLLPVAVGLAVRFATLPALLAAARLAQRQRGRRGPAPAEEAAIARAREVLR